jgi:hypothetical protein
MMNLGLFYDWAAIVKRFSTVKAFYGVGPSTPRLSSNMDGQGISFCLDRHLWPVRHGRLYQQLRYRRHSSQDHMTMQAPPICESNDNRGGNLKTITVYLLRPCSLVEVYGCFRWTYYLEFHVRSLTLKMEGTHGRSLLTFRRNLLIPPSQSTFGTEGWDGTFYPNLCKLLPDLTASHVRI